jgi:predicted dehydrogenase
MRVLFVGLEGIGQRHLRALRGTQVCVVAWRSRGVVRAISAKVEVAL